MVILASIERETSDVLPLIWTASSLMFTERDVSGQLRITATSHVPVTSRHVNSSTSTE